MSGFPQGQGPPPAQGQGHAQGQAHGHNDYDDGYGQPHGTTDSYYQDDQQYYDNHGDRGDRDGRGPPGAPGAPGAAGHQGDGYYDESYAAASLSSVHGS